MKSLIKYQIKVMSYMYALFFSLGVQPIIAQDNMDSSYSTKVGGEYQLVQQITAAGGKMPVVTQLIQKCANEVQQGGSQQGASQQNGGQQSPQQMSPEERDNKKNACLLKALNELPDGQKKQLIESFNNVNPDASDSNLSYRSSNAYLAMRNYLSQKVQTELLGGTNIETGGYNSYVDTKTFFELYKTQLSDSVLTYVSWFCLHFDNNSFTIPEDLTARQSIRQLNLKKLSEFEPVQPAQAAPPQPQTPPGAPVQPNRPNQQIQQSQQNQGTQQFTDCLQQIKFICSKTIMKAPDGSIVRDYSTVSNDYTRSQACTVVRYIREIRQAIVQTDKVKTKLASEEYNPQGFKFNTGTFYKGNYGDGTNTKEKKLNEIVSLTSNQVINESGMGNAFSTQIAKVEQCAKNANPECQKLLYNMNDYNTFQNTVRPAFDAQTMANVMAIKSMDETKFKAFLEREGKTAAEVNGILQQIKNGSSLQATLAEIARRYQDERQGIIRQMNEKLIKLNADKQMITSVANSGSAPVNGNNIKDVMETIKNETIERKLELGSVYHYRNIATAYLSVSDPQGKQTLNTRSATFELGNSLFANPAEAQSHKLDANYFQSLRDKTMKQIGKAQGQDNSYTQLQVQEINRNFLDNYLEQPGSQLTSTATTPTAGQNGPNSQNSNNPGNQPPPRPVGGPGN